MTQAGAELTPMMQQYQDLKAQVPDALLLYRMGDFYELFGPDAVQGAKVLEITVTTRDRNKENAMPMAGVPHHASTHYIQKLLNAGLKVAIAEQVEDPCATKGIVKREIVRVFSPAIRFDVEGGGTATSLLASIRRADKNSFVLTCIDPSCGEAWMSDTLDESTLLAEYERLPIGHTLVSEGELGGTLLESLRGIQGRLVELVPPSALTLERARDLLRTQFGLHDPLTYFNGVEPLVTGFALLVSTLLKSQRVERLEHLTLPKPFVSSNALRLGPNSERHLDLVSSNFGAATLSETIDRTRTAAGRRLLQAWILEPLSRCDAIERRQEAVRLLASDSSRLKRTREILQNVYDIARLQGRLHARLAGPRDLETLAQSLLSIPHLLSIGSELTACPAELARLFKALNTAWLALEPVAREIADRLVAPAPHHTREGGVFKPGFHAELDRLLALQSGGEQTLLDIESRERTQTEIGSLKVRYNRVFGYYIEVTRTHSERVPDHYRRKQSTANAERFITDELKTFEDEYLSAEARRKILENDLFDQLLERVRAHHAPITQTSHALAELDVLASFATLLTERGWCLPTIDGSLDFDVKQGRHPVVDASSRGAFVPNDLVMQPDLNRALLITGPNMGGKSTLLRQTALIVILGQAGAPVPAESARFGAVSSIFTRIGAHDAIARGQSTFMVEMTELAQLLHSADERSLLILDEIGRGTSTYDGLSIAWATLEHICSKIRARTLFATHYHELTVLDRELPALGNAHLAVAQGGKERLRFLYRLQNGPSSESFGIQVGILAGLPRAVTARASAILLQLEERSRTLHQGTFSDPAQQSLFDSTPVEPESLEPEPPEESEVLKRLRALDPNSLTPLEALNVIAGLKRELDSSQQSHSAAAIKD